MLRILIVEGNEKSARDKGAELGLPSQSQLYKDVLESLADDLEFDIAFPADEGAKLPDEKKLSDYDGIVWTGSSLNIYNGGAPVDRQVALMQKAFEGDTRIFGSCWGLQVAAVAAGGVVEENADGLEIGIAKDIEMTEEGKDHPLYRGKNPSFHAVAVHTDHVVSMPEGARVLSGNAMSPVQAIELQRGDSIFWGVQYHPEFDLEYMAGLLKKYKGDLVEKGICPDEASVDTWASDYEKAGSGGSNEDLNKKYCLDSDVLDPRIRLMELSNWLTYLRETKALSENRSQEKAEAMGA